MPREISAGAVIFRRARMAPEYLLLRYGLGHWDFVKGNIEVGEDEKFTVQREILEETGIKHVRYVEHFREVIKYSYRWKGQGIFKIVILYLVETKQKKVTLSREHIDYQWHPYQKAIRQLTYRNSKRVLLKAKRALEEERN